MFAILILYIFSFNRQWTDLIKDIVLAKVYKKSDKKIKKYIIPIHFDNKELGIIYINSILRESDIINCFSESLWENRIPSTVCGLCNAT